ncbi:MAG TPA: hypothetical protein VGN83_06935 [Falsiroseomonas sp.]|nr:hypothetical protein [Falsiroseomonas sp.]
MRLLRNGIAHGNPSFLPDGRSQIQAIRIENYDRGRLTWRRVISVQDMRALLHRFVALVEDVDHEAGQPKRTA